jgi:hypothetical protein
MSASVADLPTLGRLYDLAAELPVAKREDLTESGLPAASGSATRVFGYFWEMVHRRSGTVVGEGCCRHLPALRRQPGYDHRLTRLAEIDRSTPWTHKRRP